MHIKKQELEMLKCFVISVTYISNLLQFSVSHCLVGSVQRNMFLSRIFRSGFTNVNHYSEVKNIPTIYHCKNWHNFSNDEHAGL